MLAIYSVAARYYKLEGCVAARISRGARVFDSYPCVSNCLFAWWPAGHRTQMLTQTLSGSIRTSTPKLCGPDWPEMCVLQFLCVDNESVEQARFENPSIPHMGGLDRQFDRNE
eukprot:6108037-Heterocapsa_arctica.AAC.1